MSTRTLVSLIALTLGLACATERNTGIEPILAASHTANFSAWSEPVSLGSTINSSFNDQQAALSNDGLTLFFASTRPVSPDDQTLDLNIWVSRRACVDVDCPWGTPVLLAAPINTPVTESGPVLSRDGHELFFFSNRPGGFGAADIYVSYREHVHDDFAWGAPVNLGSGVNTDQVDGGPGYLENDDDGVAWLYFNRSTTAQVGGDIHVSERRADGSFGPAVPVSELNTAATDQRPSPHPNGLDIYIHSDRPGSSGLDIWAATRESTLHPWSAPVNVGAPVNTGAAEGLPFIYTHGGVERLYFARNVATPPAFDFDLFVSTRRREKP
jgi:hypothetical protein